MFILVLSKFYLGSFVKPHQMTYLFTSLLCFLAVEVKRVDSTSDVTLSAIN
jgi:hypothetical protein